MSRWMSGEAIAKESTGKRLPAPAQHAECPWQVAVDRRLPRTTPSPSTDSWEEQLRSNGRRYRYRLNTVSPTLEGGLQGLAGGRYRYLVSGAADPPALALGTCHGCVWGEQGGNLASKHLQALQLHDNGKSRGQSTFSAFSRPNLFGSYAIRRTSLLVNLPRHGTYEMGVINPKQPNSRLGKREAPADCGGKNQGGRCAVEGAHRRQLLPSRGNLHGDFRIAVPTRARTFMRATGSPFSGNRRRRCVGACGALSTERLVPVPSPSPVFHRLFPAKLVEVHSVEVSTLSMVPAHVRVKSRACTCRRPLPLLAR